NAFQPPAGSYKSVGRDARIRGPDGASRGAGMPFVDGRIVLGPGIGATPGRIGDLIPYFPGGDAFHDAVVAAGRKFPVLTILQPVKEGIGNTHRIVGVLAGYRFIGFAFIIAGITGGYKRSNLFFLFHLPVDELHDLGMIQVETDHLGGTARSSTGFDGAGSTVADLQKAHEAAGCATAAELLAFPANMREIGAYTGTVFKDPGFSYPKIHEPTVVDKVVFHAEDKTCMGLRAFVGRSGFFQLVVDRIDEVVALRLTRDTVALVEARIEPLRRIGYAGLVEDTIYQFIIKHPGIIFRSKISVSFAPDPPAIGHPVGDLFYRGLATQLTIGLRDARFA